MQAQRGKTKTYGQPTSTFVLGEGGLVRRSLIYFGARRLIQMWPPFEPELLAVGFTLDDCIEREEVR